MGGLAGRNPVERNERNGWSRAPESSNVRGFFRTERAPGVVVGVGAGRESSAGSRGPHSGVGMPLWGSDPVLDALERPKPPLWVLGPQAQRPEPPAARAGCGAEPHGLNRRARWKNRQKKRIEVWQQIFM